MQNDTLKPDSAAQIEAIIGYRFKDKSKLATALTHTSYSNEHREQNGSYERYEFLGDSILSYAVSKYIFNNLPDLTEGDMTKLRAMVVCEKALVRIMDDLKLHQFIRLSKGESKSSGGVRDSILADVFEAIAAAIFLDGGFREAEKFILRNISPFMQPDNNNAFEDYKTLLQEYVQQSNNSVNYCLVSSKGPEHEKTFLMQVRMDNKKIGEGRGKSKKEAAQNAAKNALDIILGGEGSHE